MEKLCGIYKITNNTNNKVYIGQSVNINGRWYCHKKTLKNNTHRNCHLQRSWNKDSMENFTHTVIELCNRNELDDKEKYYISQYNSSNDKYGYNLDGGGFSQNEISEETRIKLRLCRLGNKNRMKHSVVCLETKEIFEIMKDAETFYNISKGSISGCCTNRKKVAQNKHWLYLEDYNSSTEEQIEEKLKTAPTPYKKIINIDTNEVFNSMREASLKYKISETGISRNCRGKRPSSGGYKFMYYDKYLNNVI